jgi:hypothetical protein
MPLRGASDAKKRFPNALPFGLVANAVGITSPAHESHPDTR